MDTSAPFHWRSKPYQNCSTDNGTAALGPSFMHSLEAGVACLGHNGYNRVIFVGDSVSAQLMYTLSCVDERNRLARVRDASDKRHGIKRQGFQYMAESSNDDYLLEDSNFLLHVLSARGLQLIYLYSRPAYSYRCAPYTRSLEAALQHTKAKRLLLEPALWVINLGLWHLFPSGRRGEDRVMNYVSELCSLLQVIDTHARGRLTWRDTTAVHNTSLRANASPSERAKFGTYFTPQAVDELNRAALTVLPCFPRIQVHDGFFAATKNRAGDTLAGDTRHYGPRVLRELLQLSFRHWCGGKVPVSALPPASGSVHAAARRCGSCQTRAWLGTA